MDEREGLPAIFSLMMLAGLLGIVAIILGVLVGIGWLILRLID